MTKRVRDWFHLYLHISDEESLIAQLSSEVLDTQVATLMGAFNSFVWNETNEGWDHWDSRVQSALSRVNGSEIPEPCIADNNDPFYKAKVYFPKRPFPREKKIVGYKAPYDLFQGKIKKGDIFSKYSPHKLVMYTAQFTTRGVATEIVHTWEPLYQQNEISLTVGKNKEIIVTITADERISAQGKLIPWGQIQKLYYEMHDRHGLLPWSISYPEVTIGCTIISRYHIKQIWESFAKLNNKQI